MKTLVIDNAELADSDFNQSLIDLVGSVTGSYDVTNYADVPSPRNIESEYGAVILSGVPLDYDFDVADRRLPTYGWIKQTNSPVMGICLGHQIIGMLFGSKLIRESEAENGLIPTRMVKPDSVLLGLDNTFDSFLMHRASITAPLDFDVLARTDICKNTIMKHKLRPIYGLQQHPELSPQGMAIMKNFINMATAKSIEFSDENPPIIAGPQALPA